MPDLHQAFHVALAEASGNQYLYELVAKLPAKIEWIFNTQVRARAPISWPEHIRILDVIREGDEDAAEAITRAHVHDSAQAFLDMLEQRSSNRRDSAPR
jgi:DNA-binding FadR family transcriptional regulator